MIRTASNYENTLNIFNGLSFLPELNHLEFELLKYHCLIFNFLTFSSCHLTDLEVVAYAQGLTQMKQLKYFSLKVLQ